MRMNYWYLKQIELYTCTVLWVGVKLSKFSHPSTDGANVYFCIVYLLVNKMATVQEHGGCVSKFCETKSVIQAKQLLHTFQ